MVYKFSEKALLKGNIKKMFPRPADMRFIFNSKNSAIMFDSVSLEILELDLYKTRDSHLIQTNEEVPGKLFISASLLKMYGFKLNSPIFKNIDVEVLEVV